MTAVASSRKAREARPTDLERLHSGMKKESVPPWMNIARGMWKGEKISDLQQICKGREENS